MQRTVRETRPELRVGKDYLGYMVRISELERVYFVLQNADQWAERFTNGIYAHGDWVRNDRLRLCQSGRGVIII